MTVVTSVVLGWLMKVQWVFVAAFGSSDDELCALTIFFGEFFARAGTNSTGRKTIQNTSNDPIDAEDGLVCGLGYLPRYSTKPPVSCDEMSQVLNLRRTPSVSVGGVPEVFEVKIR